MDVPPVFRQGRVANDRPGRPALRKRSRNGVPNFGAKNSVMRVGERGRAPNRCGGAAVRRLGSMPRALREGFKTNPRLYFSQDCTEPGGCQGFFCFRIAGAEPLAAQAVVVSNPPLPLLRHCRNRLAGGGGRARV